jgi:hypothetical protein
LTSGSILPCAGAAVSTAVVAVGSAGVLVGVASGWAAVVAVGTVSDWTAVVAVGAVSGWTAWVAWEAHALNRSDRDVTRVITIKNERRIVNLLLLIKWIFHSIHSIISCED